MVSKNCPLHMLFNVPALAEKARACESEALRSNFDVGQEELEDSFRAFEDQSVFLTISDDDDEVVAAARFVLPGPAGFISLHEMSAYGWRTDGHAAAQNVGLDLANTWDIASMGRRPDVPGGNKLALALSHGLVLAVRANNISGTVAMMNESVRSYLSMFGLIYTTFPGAATLPFFGSPATTPVYTRVNEFLDTARRINPEGYRLVGLGIGLDGISVPPMDHFIVARQAQQIDLVAREASEPAISRGGRP